VFYSYCKNRLYTQLLNKKRTAEFSSCSFSLLLILITAVSETCPTAILTDTDYL